MRKRFRHGRRRAFHLYHACVTVPMRLLVDMEARILLGGVGGLSKHHRQPHTWRHLSLLRHTMLPATHPRHAPLLPLSVGLRRETFAFPIYICAATTNDLNSCITVSVSLSSLSSIFSRSRHQLDNLAATLPRRRQFLPRSHPACSVHIRNPPTSALHPAPSNSSACGDDNSNSLSETTKQQQATEALHLFDKPFLTTGHHHKPWRP